LIDEYVQDEPRTDDDVHFDRPPADPEPSTKEPESVGRSDSEQTLSRNVVIRQAQVSQESAEADASQSDLLNQANTSTSSTNISHIPPFLSLKPTWSSPTLTTSNESFPSRPIPFSLDAERSTEHDIHPNYNSLPTLSSRLMSALLSRPPTQGTSTSTRKTHDGLFMTPSNVISDRNLEHQYPNRSASLFASSATIQHTQTLPISITHGSSFSSLSFIPPSGAPGFLGDHTWDRGFSDDFDKTEDHSGSVILKDRLEGEGYEGVLDVPLADKVNWIVEHHH
jgi:hypothetical protein